MFVLAPRPAGAQPATILAVGDEVQLKAPAFAFIKGDALNRLKEGRPVRFEFSVAVMDALRGRVLTEARQSFNLSYDLWEERFAVTRIGGNGRGAGGSISHLTAKDAEAWCLDHLPLSATNISTHAGAGKPFWIRVHYEVADRTAAPGTEEQGLTLHSLIAILSRRQADQQTGLLEAGPFRLQD
jgi:hypothetical protein